jgi:hypothetical protein
MSDSCDVEIQIAGLAGCCCNSGAVEQCELGFSEDGGGGTGRFGSAQHRHPEYPPCGDAGEGDAIGNRSAVVRRISSIRQQLRLTIDTSEEILR